MKYLINLLIFISISSCSKDKEEVFYFLDCEYFTGNYESYNGENIGCRYYYTLTEYYGDQYIELNSHCVDLTRPIVINEDCQDICEKNPYDPNSECGLYLSNREIVEITLIEK